MKSQLDILKREVELAFGVEDISVESKEKLPSFARFVFYEKAKDDGFTLSQISRFIGRTHASVINGIRKIPGYLQTYPEFRDMYMQIDRMKALQDLSDEDQKILYLTEKLEAALASLSHHKILLNEARKGKIPNSHKTLHSLIDSIPDYHVKTVEMRLRPMIRMLEKPCRYNNFLRESSHA